MSGPRASGAAVLGHESLPVAPSEAWRSESQCARLAAPLEPAFPAVELTYEQEPATRCSVDVGGELGDLALELLERHPICATGSIRASGRAEHTFGTYCPDRMVDQPWISQPSVARAASITVSAKAGWGWIVRATSW